MSNSCSSEGTVAVEEDIVSSFALFSEVQAKPVNKHTTIRQTTEDLIILLFTSITQFDPFHLSLFSTENKKGSNMVRTFSIIKPIKPKFQATQTSNLLDRKSVV